MLNLNLSLKSITNGFSKTFFNVVSNYKYDLRESGADRVKY
jgi:hypothetical protein